MAEFRTGHRQYTVPLDVAVIGTINEGTEVTSANRKAAICRGDFVVYTPATGSVPAYITKATAAQVTSKTATHIIALTDQTVGGPDRTPLSTETVSELVGATASAAAAGAAIKKVGLYPIWDWTDIIPAADGVDVKA